MLLSEFAMSSATTPLFSAKNVISPKIPPTNAVRPERPQRVLAELLVDAYLVGDHAGHDAHESARTLPAAKQNSRSGRRHVARVDQPSTASASRASSDHRQPQQHPADVTICPERTAALR